MSALLAGYAKAYGVDIKFIDIKNPTVSEFISDHSKFMYDVGKALQILNDENEKLKI